MKNNFGKYKSRVGPTKLNEEEKRTHCVSVRLAESELSELDKKRKKVGLKRGEYLRAAGFNALPPQIPEINKNAWIELSRAASNLNQIAKALNVGENPEIKYIEKKLQEFRDRLLK